ncbi:hypothetical protein D3C73_1078550 [compost metagenome]
MSIAPIAHFGILAQIVVTDIHPPGKTYPPVDHHHFTVIPVIEPAFQQRTKRRQKEMHLHPGIPQCPDKPPAETMAAQTVAEQTHLHPLACFADHHIQELFTGRVIAKNIKFHMYMLPRRLHCLKHGIIRLLCVCQHPALITSCNLPARQSGEQTQQLPAPCKGRIPAFLRLADNFAFALDMGLNLTAPLRCAAFPNGPSMPIIPAQKIVEQQPERRAAEAEKHPGQRPLRPAVFQQHDKSNLQYKKTE